MAEQRRSQPGRHHRRGLPCGRGLALLLPLTLLLAACGSDATAPVEDRPGTGFGSGVSGARDPATILIGVWRADTVVEVPGDFQAWTTIWEFNADGSCRQTVVTESLVEGIPRTTRQTCIWTANDGKLSVTFASGALLTFDFSFAGLSPDRLVLDGFEYARQA